MTFDDTAAGNTNPILITAGGVQPLAVYFNNNLLTYSFAGGAIGGAATTVNINDGGLVIFDNANTYGGQTTITSGTLQLGNGAVNGSVAAGGGITVGGVLAIDNATAQTFSGVISGGGAINLMAPSLVTLTNANGFSGTTTVSAGTLQFGNSTLGGNIVNNASLAFNNATAQAYAGSITGAGSLLKFGTGAVTLSGSSSFGGATTVSAGSMALATGGALSTSALTIAGGGATLFAVNGGTLTSTGLAAFNTGGGSDGFSITGGLANFQGGINFSTDTNSAGNLLSVTGGTLTTSFISSGAREALSPACRRRPSRLPAEFTSTAAF